VFVISVAAQLADMHPQTLRNYEREGLLSPERSAGGNRMYSENDLARLATISDLAARGLNISGIRLVLELQAEVMALTSQVEQLKAERDERLP
jgi:MerR family transcriptional regulator/heat shock protein HspR